MFGGKKLEFWWKYFPSINFVGLHPLSSNLYLVKWDLHEGYGGSNLVVNGSYYFNFCSIEKS